MDCSYNILTNIVTNWTSTLVLVVNHMYTYISSNMWDLIFYRA